MHETPIARRIAFIVEIDKLKGVLRKNKPVTLERYENAAEHSWQVALLALTLAPHAPVALDIERVIRLLLVHDIGEIDSGDTLFYAASAEDKAEEAKGARRIFSLLPPAQAAEMFALWEEFEAAQSAEARFARAMDRLMPILLNLNREGQSWRENGVRADDVRSRAASQVDAGCPDAGRWLADALENAEERGYFAR